MENLIVVGPNKIEVMGLEFDHWTCESCSADFVTGPGYATLAYIKSEVPSKGHASALLLAAKDYYEGQRLKFGGSVALNDRMRFIYQRLNIHEYSEDV